MAIDMSCKDLLLLAGVGALVAAAGVPARAGTAASTTALTDVPGFKGQDPNGSYYLIAHAGTYDTYWATVAHGVAAAGKVLGVRAIFQAPDHYDPGKQASMVSAAASAGCSGIATTGAPAPALIGPLKTAAEAGIPVVLCDTPVPTDYAGRFVDGSPLGFVGSDIGFAAQEVAEQVAPLLSQGAHVLIINHEPGNPVLKIKTDGFVKGLASINPKVDQLNIGEETTRSIEILRGFYSSHKDIKAIFALGAPGNAIAVRFLDEEKIPPDQIRVAGSDVDAFTLDALKNNKMVATIGLPSFLFGFLPIVMLYTYNAYAIDPGLYLQRSGQLITSKDVPMLAALAAKGLR